MLHDRDRHLLRFPHLLFRLRVGKTAGYFLLVVPRERHIIGKVQLPINLIQNTSSICFFP
jgi:hypothetical protein